MVKKIILFIVTSILVISCNRNLEVLSPMLNSTEESVFILEANDIERTRSASDITHINQLKYAVYDKNSGRMMIERTIMDDELFSSGSYSMKVPLLKDHEYIIVFWAQNSESDLYEILFETMKINMNYDKISNNNPIHDAFFAKTNIKTGNSIHKVVLTRPLAQINLITSLDCWEHATVKGNKIVQSAVTIKNVGTCWDFSDELSISSNKDVSFEMADIPTNNIIVDIDGIEKEYKLLSMCYVLAPIDPVKQEIEFQLKDEKDKMTVIGPIGNLTLKRNNRTNVIYDLKPMSTEYSLFYTNIQDALNGIINNNFEENASTDSQGAKVAVYMENNIPHIVLMDNIITDKLQITQEIQIELNGYKLTTMDETIFEIVKEGKLYIDGLVTGSEICVYAKDNLNQSSLIVIDGGSCYINGGNYYTSTHGAGIKDNPYASIIIEEGGSLNIKNASIKAYDDDGGAVSAIRVNEKATFVANDCMIEADSKRGLAANAIYSYGYVTLTDCSIIGKADHTANSAGNDYGTTSRGVLAEDGSLTVQNCYVYGMHSGMTVKCELLVNEGIYDGYSHGGIYFAAEGDTARIYNATLRDAELLEGYIDDGIAGTNHAGIYIGGAKNMNVYMDNCDIYGYLQPIVMKSNASPSNLYISNSTINLDYSGKGIRNDSQNKIYFGKGNNFGPQNLYYKNGYYEETSDEYKFY